MEKVNYFAIKIIRTGTCGDNKQEMYIVTANNPVSALGCLEQALNNQSIRDYEDHIVLEINFIGEFEKSLDMNTCIAYTDYGNYVDDKSEVKTLIHKEKIEPDADGGETGI